MALFKDQPASSMEDLQGHDTQLLDVAAVEGIDVTRKLALAQEEVSMELATVLARLDGPLQAGSLTGRVCLRSVVVTPHLKLWHTFHTLELVYRDAYNSQLNDRYAGKRDEYRELAKWAYEKLIQNGIGIALDPIEQAEEPALEPVPGGLPDQTYYVSAAWTNAAGDEGASSRPSTIATAGGSFMAWTAEAPRNVRGWNLYAGVSPDALVLQNPAPLGLDETWTQKSPLLTAGRRAGSGQTPNYLRSAARVLQRG